MASNPDAQAVVPGMNITVGDNSTVFVQSDGNTLQNLQNAKNSGNQNIGAELRKQLEELAKVVLAEPQLQGQLPAVAGLLEASKHAPPSAEPEKVKLKQRWESIASVVNASASCATLVQAIGPLLLTWLSAV